MSEINAPKPSLIQEPISENIPLEEFTETPPAEKSESFKKFVSDIDNAKKINEILIENKDFETLQKDLPISSTISKTTNTLREINAIKSELCKLPLDPCENEFIDTNVTPLLTVLTQLASASVSLSTSVYYLTISPIVHAKHSEIKDTLHLVYNINDECEDVYHIVKKRINTILHKKC